MQPNVGQTELQNALGVLPQTEGKAYAIVSVSEKGAIGVPGGYMSITALLADFGRGPGVEAAAHYIEKYSKPVLFVRTTASTPGSYLGSVSSAPGAIGAITKTGTGTATYANNSSAPSRAADVVILFNVGGTQGVAGIVYQWSLDNGNTWSPPHALGTATHIDVTGTGASVSVSGSGTVVAGDFISFHLTAPISASAGTIAATGFETPPTLDAATHPFDDYEVAILFVSGGEVGVAGITYQWSLDNGRTYSPITALGTATSIVLADAGGVKIDLDDTIDDGALLTFPTVAPKWNTTDLGIGLDALKATKHAWEGVHVIGPCSADDADVIDAKITGMAAAGKFKWFACSARLPVGAESESTYAASLEADFAEFETVFGVVCAGAIQTVSSVTSRKYKRPLSFTAIAREASQSHELNNAEVGLGALPVTKITDSLNNTIHHDESINPGLDDLRFYVARSWEDYEGVYVNRPLLFSPTGSDFRILPHRRVMNLSRAATRAYLIKRLNKPTLVNATTGFLLEETATEIESGGLDAMSGVVMTKPKASGVMFVINRSDNLLAGAPMQVKDRVIPLAYPETILEEVGFLNPANVVTG